VAPYYTALIALSLLAPILPSSSCLCKSRARPDLSSNAIGLVWRNYETSMHEGTESLIVHGAGCYDAGSNTILPLAI